MPNSGLSRIEQMYARWFRDEVFMVRILAFARMRS